MFTCLLTSERLPVGVTWRPLPGRLPVGVICRPLPGRLPVGVICLPLPGRLVGGVTVLPLVGLLDGGVTRDLPALTGRLVMQSRSEKKPTAAHTRADLTYSGGLFVQCDHARWSHCKIRT